MTYLTKQQREDIKKSYRQIAADIKELDNSVQLTDNQLLFFYEELKTKADFAYNFIKCAEMYSRLKNNEKIDIP